MDAGRKSARRRGRRRATGEEGGYCQGNDSESGEEEGNEEDSLHPAADIEILSQANLTGDDGEGEAEASASEPSNAVAGTLSATTSDARPPTSPPGELASDVRASSSSPLSQESQTARLQQMLENLHRDLSFSVTLPRLDCTLIKKRGIRAPLQEIFATLTTVNDGTQNAAFAGVKESVDEPCSCCNKTFREVNKKRKARGTCKRWDVLEHLMRCAAPKFATGRHVFSSWQAILAGWKHVPA